MRVSAQKQIAAILNHSYVLHVNPGCCEASNQLPKLCVIDGDFILTLQVWKLSRTQHVAVLVTELLNGVFQLEEGQASPSCWRTQGLQHLPVLGPAALEVADELSALVCPQELQQVQ